MTYGRPTHRAKPIDLHAVLRVPAWRRWLRALWVRVAARRPSLKQCGKWPAARRVVDLDLRRS